MVFTIGIVKFHLCDIEKRRPRGHSTHLGIMAVKKQKSI